MLTGPAKWHHAATEVLRQHRAREAFAALRADLAPDNAHAAYLIQDDYVAQLLEQRGTSLAGYKIGITTPAMRDMVGFHDSVSGRVLRDRVYRTGHRVVAADFVRLIVEFEIAFELGQDLPARDSPWTSTTVLQDVACAYPALEIADDRSADYTSLPQSVLTLIADNAWNQGLVLGPPVRALEADALQSTEGIAFIDEREVGRGTGRDVLGHPLNALAWLANHLQARGIAMKAGDIVSTGSLVKSQFPRAGNRVAFRLPGFGEVRLDIE